MPVRGQGFARPRYAHINAQNWPSACAGRGAPSHVTSSERALIGDGLLGAEEEDGDGVVEVDEEGETFRDSSPQGIAALNAK